jgi:ATP-binding cassette, subfamily C (CFTR/MRP), member 1
MFVSLLSAVFLVLMNFFAGHEKLEDDNETQTCFYDINWRTEYFFTWLNPLIYLGSKKVLEMSDIPSFPSEQGSLNTTNALKVFWKEEKVKQFPSLYLAIFRSFSSFLLYGVLSCSIYVFVLSIQPFLVTSLLEYVRTGSSKLLGIESGIGLAFLLGSSSVLGAFMANSGLYLFYLFGLYTKSAVTGLIYEKSLTISNSVKSKSSVGEIMTLMSVDVERVWTASFLLSWLGMCPTLALIAVILLFLEVGLAAIPVAIFLLLFAYLQELASKAIGNTRQQLVRHTVERAKLTNEALQGIRVVKMYAWENAVGDKIEAVRSKEVVMLKKYLRLKIINTVRCTQHTSNPLHSSSDFSLPF